MSDTPILVGTSDPPDPPKSISIGFAEITDMLALLRRVAACEPDDITVVLPFELQDEVRALLDRIDRTNSAP